MLDPILALYSGLFNGLALLGLGLWPCKIGGWALTLAVLWRGMWAAWIGLCSTWPGSWFVWMWMEYRGLNKPKAPPPQPGEVGWKRPVRWVEGMPEVAVFNPDGTVRYWEPAPDLREQQQPVVKKQQPTVRLAGRPV